MFIFQDREWFAGDCNRKTAEDLLQRINKVNLVVLKWYKKVMMVCLADTQT